ncbi:N-lysine methyltransferase SETD6-like protein [Cladobotryum mycophilum]|uniref:N-lysine methyltransferase SETD6-like protein n=1 Tax=Cladobotryum mycophilum TaxID=491253 RepID=A0ABR0SNY9_9HYPO
MDFADFDYRTAAFFEWFQTRPGTQFSSLVKIVDLRSRGAGRGMVATRDIPKDTLLFEIPRNLIINTKTSELRNRMPYLFPEDDGEDSSMDLDDVMKQDAWSSLMLVMMFEYFQGDASPWKPYLDILPESFETPMFWSDSELEELQASATLPKIGKENAEKMFQIKVLPVIRGYPDVFPLSQQRSDEDLVELAHRMGSTIMAYAFDFENENKQEDEEEEWVEDYEVGSTMGMVPMADILNADAEFNVNVSYRDNSLAVITSRPIKAGEEVLNYYGPHPNSELLRRYGYVTAKHSRYDVAEIPWSVLEGVVVAHLGLSTEQLAKAREHMDPDEKEDGFILEREYEEPNPEGKLLGQARFTELSEDLLEQLKTFLKAVRKVDASSMPDKRKRDEVQHAVLIKLMDALMSRYPTTILEDERLLSDTNLNERHRMAIAVRLGEKKLILEAKEFLFTAAAAAAAADAGSDDHTTPHKRAKR